MASSITVGRTTTTLLRTLFRKPFSIPKPTRISPSLSSSPSRLLLRRELSSLVPVHSAVASACLVSKLPDRPNASAVCRFANYVSPI